MSIALDHWLTEHRDRLLPGWTSALAPETAATNGDGDGFDPIARHTLEVDAPFPDLPSKEVIESLPRIYEGLVLGARGDLTELDLYLQTMVMDNRIQQMKLPDLVSMSSHLRRLAWDIFEHDVQHHDGGPASVFVLMRELDDLLEHTLACVAKHWETTINDEIQERISQAEFIAESMAVAIEQADRTALQLSSLNLASQRLTSSLENTDALIEQVGSTLLELLGSFHISIWLPIDSITRHQDEQSDTPLSQVTLQAVHCWGENEESVKGHCLSSTHEGDIIFRSFHDSKIVIDSCPDTAMQGPWYLASCGVMALPLIVKDKATGVVVLQDPHPEERFSRSQQDLARALINQSAIALENARLYSKIREFNTELEQLVAKRTSEVQAEKDRLRTVHEISTEISSTLDLDMLLDTSLNALARITNVEYGSIMLLETDTGHLVNRAALGHDSVNTFTRFPIGTGIAGWVAQHKKPALINDVRSDSRWVPPPMTMTDTMSKQEGSLVAVPLVAHSEILGVLTLSHSTPGYFNEDHLRLLTASAGAIAIGINNANMYNTIFGEMERSSELLHRQQMETSKMEAILQSLSVGVLVSDTYGGILSANQAAGRILQREIEDLFMGTTLHDVLAHLLQQRVGDMPLDDLLAFPLDDHENPRFFESTLEVNMHIIRLTMGPVLKDDGEMVGALLLMHDITREVESDRLKTEFIGTMSHELRTPMTAIKGFTQLLAMGGLGPVNDTQREFLSTIQNNAERMISMINDVLDITKIETGSIDLDLRPIHLAEALSSVVSDLQNLINGRGHTLSVNVPTTLPLVHADTSRLHQVLSNLLSNAAKYTPQGGEIWVDAHEVTNENLSDQARGRVSKDVRYVQVQIRDTGIGIAENELNLIFERFYRTENQLKVEAGGTGLGLSLVKPLVELLGGCIWVDSVMGEGSTFTFILPAV